MSDAPSSRRTKSTPEIDISTGKKDSLGWRGTFIVWGSVFGLALLLFILNAVWEVAILWGATALLAAVILVLAAWVTWLLVVQRGVLTWLRLAHKPATLMALGQNEAAEAACVQALARANRFATDDHRRGLMLCELAMFVKNQGRYQEGLDLYEESVRIFAQDVKKWPLDYFVALNNYGICFISLKDFAAAQRILEKAVDMTLSARKREAGAFVTMALGQVQALQCVMHMNLAVLFMEMRELDEAGAHLREADAIVPLLSKRMLASWHDHYVAVCALWEFESGKFAAAESEIAEVRNQDYPTCLRVRAKLLLVRQEFAEAEALLLKYQAAERKKGTLRLPEQLRPTLEFAEALFGQNKHEEAFAALQEARGIVADFRIPADEAWRQTLQRWAKRARELGMADVDTALAEELRTIPAASDQAITILEKFRV